MKNLLIIVLLCMGSLAVNAQQPYPDTRGLSQTDYEALIKAVGLVDNGLSDLALPEFDRIVAANPDNYLAQYERLYALCQMGRFSDALKNYKKILKHREASPLTYQLAFVALSNEKRAKEAQKVLKEGLKRFPDSGVLNLMAGVKNLEENKISEALINFNQGINSEPMFWKNYAQAAKILCRIDKYKVWGLAYAETTMLLSHAQDIDIFMDLSRTMRDLYKDNLTIMPDTVIANLSPANDIICIKGDDKNKGVSADPLSTPNTVLGFPGVYNDCVKLSLKEMAGTDQEFTASPDQLARLRKATLENYYSKALNMYGDSMYLFPFQKEVLNAGYWEEYNYYLFGFLFPEEFEKWYTENEDKMHKFLEWCFDDKFVLDKTHTVGMDSIYRDALVMPMLGALMFEANLLGTGDPEEEKERADKLQKMLEEGKIVRAGTLNLGR